MLRRVQALSARSLALTLVTLASLCAALAALRAPTTSAQSPPLAARGGAPYELRVWHSYGEAEEAGLRAAIREFERLHPEVDVRVLAVPYGAYASKLEAAIPAQRGPDLFIDAHDRLPSYLEGALVEPFGELDADLAAEFSALHLDALRVDGSLFGVPLSVKSAALFVNDDLVGELRVDALEDLEELARTLPEGTFALAWDADNAYDAAAIVHAYGAALLTAEGEYAFVGPDAERAMEHLLRLVSSGVVPEEGSYDLTRGLFGSGRAAAAISGPWMVAELPDSLHYSVRPLPIVRGASAQGAAMVPFATVEAAFVAANARQPEAARALARFLAGPQGAILRARHGRHIVAAQSAWQDPALAGDSMLVAFREAASHARPMSTHPLMRSTFVPAERALRKILRRDGTIPGALEEGQHRFLDETRPPPPEADPTPGLLVLGLLMLYAAFVAVRNARDPKFRVELARSMTAYRYIAHAVVAVGLLVILPLVVGGATSFFGGHGRDLHYVGAANYIDILTARGGDLLGSGSFWLVLLVTVLWTLVNLFFHVAIGIAVALLLSRKELFGRGLYRVLLVLPWAVPSYVTALAWRGMFHRQFGAVNAILETLGVEPISWFASWATAFTANVTTNVWLGFPFMMVVTLGALTSIPRDVYEAAAVDGATEWQQFRFITLPLLVPSIAPAVAMGAVWTFNMFNVVFLVSAGEPDGGTEILVSEAYRWAFTRGHQMGYAAAYAVLIFVILFFGTRLLGALTSPAKSARRAGGHP